MQLKWQKPVKQPTTLVDFIASHGALSKTATKKALAFGGGWVKAQGTGKLKRVRRATTPLQPGDTVAFYYDERLLKATAPEAKPVQESKHWGIWFKPANVPAQGTPYGDIGCMEQQVKVLSKKSRVFLIHRLDKEAAGLMIFAYSKEAAAAISKLWQDHSVQKFYQAIVKGQPNPASGEINQPLEGKSARTLYQVIDTDSNTSQVDIEIKTGRFHQIRKHFDFIGHPLLGDPKYGTANAHKGGMQLLAVRLVFLCPYSRQKIDCCVPRNAQLNLLPISEY